MSGDVQPRKRKDKKRKRDDEPREQHQGVHGSKMGNEDVHLHVQGEHETGGHWCAKLFFFSLLAILLGLIGLIILENRGLADLDTPLSESRFSNYFDGWVDEHREAHDEHDAVTASIEEHEHGDEPFEEEEDHSEVDEAEDDEEEKDHDDEEEDDEENEEDDENTKENEENDNETEELEAETAEEAEDETQEDEENDDHENEVENSVEETREDEDEEADEKNTNDDDNEDEDDEEINENDQNKEDEDDEDTIEDIEPPQTRSQQSPQTASSAQSKTKEEDDDNDDDDEPFEEEDDDGTFESLESVVVDNDAEELLILQEKARQQQATLKKGEPEPEEETPSYTSSLAVKIGVGVALALVARLVLVRKNPNTNVTEEDDAMNLEQSGEEEYIEEEIEEEEEIEVTDEDYEEEKIEEPLKYKPQTFEQLNAMYRQPRESQPTAIQTEPTQKTTPTKLYSDEPKTSQREEQLPVAASKPSQSRFAHYHREKSPPPAVSMKLTQLSSNLPPQEKVESKDSRAYSDEHEEDIEYDDDEELYDDEMLDEEEEEDIGDDEEDEEDLSDVDDSELMNRLEAKYGRLPAKEVESDEDVGDQSWTKIKPRNGGPQAMDDDEFEEELKKANEEMLRENLNSALTLFESLSQKFPDKPEAFLGKAKILDKQSEIHRSNSKLTQALDAYKRYLAFDEDIHDDKEFSEVAQRCVDRMRFMGLNLQAVPIHEMLIERYPNEVSHRNQLAVTYLMLNRLSEAKHALEENLARWPNDGFAMVHYGFVLKNLNQNLPLAVDYLRRGIDSKSQGTQDGRFYFSLGDSLQRLGRVEEAREIYRRGEAAKLFLSEYQRSLYNIDSLRAQPFWSKKETGYEEFLNQIEKNWQVIRDEGLSALKAKGAFENETENLRDSGDWKQFELYARGQRRINNCLEAPVTCGIIEMFPSARFCKRGQVKFSVMHPGTHVWPHCGPTNCRLRAHLGLKVPSGTLLRVAEEKRTWQEGKFLIFDDSFEHEVWHNGTSPRLVLIVDIWHPDLTEQQRQSLSPI